MIQLPLRRVGIRSVSKTQPDCRVDCRAAKGHVDCWKCQERMHCPLLFCKGCGSLLEAAQEQSYFAMFGMQETYNVDVKMLETTFKSLQRQLHPDKFASKCPKEQGLSSDRSSTVNHAYATLKDPLARARYLLDLKGADIKEAETISDPEMLMEIMEIRETIEDAAGNPQQLRRLQTENAARISSCERSLHQAFSSQDLTAARNQTLYLTYLRSAQDLLDAQAPLT